MPQRIIVIGLGCAGSAACAELSRRGAEVIGLDQFEIGHTRGGSAHQSRAFRLAYYEHSGYVPLLSRAREGWIQLNDETSEPPFIETGGLYISHQDGSLAPDSIAAAKMHGIEHVELTARQIRDRWPVFDITDEMIGIFEPLAGLVVPERAVAAHIEIARRNGTQIMERTRVLGWQPYKSGIKVDTSSGTLEADHLVICAGAWAGPLAGPETLDVRPSRQVLAWFDVTHETGIDAPELPVWALELQDTSLLYGFPRMSGLPGPEGFKVARHWPGPTVDPDDVKAMAVQPGDESDVAPHLARWLPKAAGPATTVHTCLYANSPDGHFRIGHHPDCDRVSIIGALSGHGFKFQPVLGELAADLALKGHVDFDLNFLNLH
ncbi:MAG: N-methyl-L-tryptophan oxidase [Phycisphaerales bacterium]|nr:N-methyl-L-tryptophan oxidase [Phycisphaerales bacterium]